VLSSDNAPLACPRKLALRWRMTFVVEERSWNLDEAVCIGSALA
jgi:hypothetical protein